MRLLASPSRRAGGRYIKSFRGLFGGCKKKAAPAAEAKEPPAATPNE